MWTLFKKKPLIYILDDQEDINTIMEDIVKDIINCKVEKFSCGNHLLKKLNLESPPDLIISDIVLPKMSGFDLKNIIIKQGIEPNFIFMTGLGKNTFEQNDVIIMEKPIDKDKLKENIFKSLNINHS